MNNTQEFSHCYTPADREQFIHYMHDGIQRLQGERDELINIFLGIYANPIHHCK